MNPKLRRLIEACCEADDAAELCELVAEVKRTLAPSGYPAELAAIRAAGRVLEADPVEAERLLREKLRAPDSKPRPIVEWSGEREPAPVLWRAEPDGDGSRPGVVLSVGEIAILSAPGGSGKSYITLAIARAAARAGKGEAAGEAHGAPFGEACGLGVRGGPVAIVSYEDSPVRMAVRLKRLGGAPDTIYCIPEPEPLFLGGADRRHGEARPGPAWGPLWEELGALDPPPGLVVVDPLSSALADVSVSEAGPVRAFVRTLSREAARLKAGVLLVAHDTKAARNEARQGGEPGAGAVAGSAAWHDGARGVLYLLRRENCRELTCIKANYGPSGWVVPLVERSHEGQFAGFDVPPSGGLRRPSP